VGSTVSEGGNKSHGWCVGDYYLWGGEEQELNGRCGKN
jgi:hypothetical protein